MSTTENVVYGLLFLTLIGMGWFIYQRGKRNIEVAKEQAAPKIAGSDVMDGGAKNPDQFNEPDEDALQAMADLLGEDFED